jgi:hypothetical protein
MCAGQNLERAVVLAAIIKMDPNGKHSFQNFNGWLNVQNAFLDGPGTEAGEVDSLFNGNHLVLVRGHRPISFGCLIEKHRPDRVRLFSRMLLDNPTDHISIGKRAYRAIAQQAAAPRRGHRAKSSNQASDLWTRKNLRDHCVSIRV